VSISAYKYNSMASAARHTHNDTMRMTICICPVYVQRLGAGLARGSESFGRVHSCSGSEPWYRSLIRPWLASRRARQASRRVSCCSSSKPSHGIHCELQNDCAKRVRPGEGGQTETKRSERPGE
jgi:hypothetical protein